MINVALDRNQRSKYRVGRWRIIEEKFNLKHSNNLRLWKKLLIYRGSQGTEVVKVQRGSSCRGGQVSWSQDGPYPYLEIIKRRLFHRPFSMSENTAL